MIDIELVKHLSNNHYIQFILFLSLLFGIIYKARNELKIMYQNIISEYDKLLNEIKERENTCKEELEIIKNDIIKLKIELNKLK